MFDLVFNYFVFIVLLRLPYRRDAKFCVSLNNNNNNDDDYPTTNK